MIFLHTEFDKHNFFNKRFKIFKIIKTGSQTKKIFMIYDHDEVRFLALYVFAANLQNFERLLFEYDVQLITNRYIRHIFFCSSVNFIFEDFNEFAFASDWCNGKDLFIQSEKYILQQYFQHIFQLVQQIHLLHQQNIYHLDIKEENILFLNNSPILTDFGSAKSKITLALSRQPSSECLSEDDNNLQHIDSCSKFEISSTDAYRPPEPIVILELHDSYQLGQVLYHSLTGEYYTNLKKQILNKQFNEFFSDNITDLVFGLLDNKPHRYYIYEIIDHPCFSKKYTLDQFKQQLEEKRQSKYLNDNLFNIQNKFLISKIPNFSKPKILVNNSKENQSQEISIQDQRFIQFENYTLSQFRIGYQRATIKRTQSLETSDSEGYSDDLTNNSSYSIFMGSATTIKRQTINIDLSLSNSAEFDEIHSVNNDLDGLFFQENPNIEYE
ncbi:Kinase [Spironucleus salmonicida]|uniref:Kinase n=1 Tax=Spironucleus salmonicida TaxID=348837 RepID=V6M1R4_9EUKA|nr:Kinase [Spironucleus salmonicida]|eukprot:EST47149.1 Kinase [Spironucleus salmonicida]